MGFADFFSDLYASVVSQDVVAEAPDDQQEDLNSGENQGTGKSTTAQQSGQSTTRGGVSTRSPASGTEEESDEESDINKADYKGGNGDDSTGHRPGTGGEASGQQPPEDDEEEEEEEEEEEPEDPKPKFEEECAESKQCAPAKHHYDECVERVTKQQEEEGKANEDCVEEFFHLAHCATQCAAPKLFAALK